MYNNIKIGISIRFYPDLMRTIDDLAHLEFEGNVTETIISLVNDGLKLRKFQKMVIDNPEKQDEIISQMNAKVENESILDWLATKTDRQKKAYRDFLNEDLDGIS